jgi:hypothetical protein
MTCVRPHGHSARGRFVVAWWRGRCDLASGLGVAAVAASAPIKPGARRVRRSGSKLTRVEAVEDASGGSVQRRRGSSGDG